MEKIDYLGVVVSHNKIKMDPKKVKAIAEWPNPKCVRDIQMFVGLCSYYCKFISDLATLLNLFIASPKRIHPGIGTRRSRAHGIS